MRAGSRHGGRMSNARIRHSDRQGSAAAAPRHRARLFSRGRASIFRSRSFSAGPRSRAPMTRACSRSASWDRRRQPRRSPAARASGSSRAACGAVRCNTSSRRLRFATGATFAERPSRRCRSAVAATGSCAKCCSVTASIPTRTSRSWAWASAIPMSSICFARASSPARCSRSPTSRSAKAAARFVSCWRSPTRRFVPTCSGAWSLPGPDTIANEPELIRAVLRGCQKSYRYAAAHRDEWIAFGADYFGIARETMANSIERESAGLALRRRDRHARAAAGDRFADAPRRDQAADARGGHRRFAFSARLPQAPQRSSRVHRHEERVMLAYASIHVQPAQNGSWRPGRLD